MSSKPELFSLDDLDRLKDAFDSFDLNGDGSISADELGEVLRHQLGQTVTQEELAAMIDAVDETRDRTVRFKEFITMMGHHPGNTVPIGPTAIRATFNLLDTDRDGFITAEELSRNWPQILGEPITLAEAIEMIGMVDKDLDGQLNFEEFQRIASILPL